MIIQSRSIPLLKKKREIDKRLNNTRIVMNAILSGKAKIVVRNNESVLLEIK